MFPIIEIKIPRGKLMVNVFQIVSIEQNPSSSERCTINLANGKTIDCREPYDELRTMVKPHRPNNRDD